MMGVWRLLLALWLATLAAAASAQTFPKFTGFVVDAANVLPPATKADLTQKLAALQKDTHGELVVATIPDLHGQDLATYGYQLGRLWGVGLRDVNNGAVLFIAPNEPAGHRGPRVEVGYGLEPVLTDALSSVIINRDMMPKLRAGDVPGAMEAGTDALIGQLRASPDEAKANTDAAIAAFDRTHRRAAGGSGGGVPIGLIFWGMVIGFVVLSMLRRRGGVGQSYAGGGGSGSTLPIVLWGLGNALGGGGESRGGWDGGGSGSDSGSDGGWGGGGFSGGGGGSFGGGGASGSW